MSTSMENKEPLVSVIIPTYNMAEFINEAIKSVLSQTYQKFEIIVVDDVSTDHTHEIVATIQDSRLRLICHSENSGPSVARNTGIMAAKGELIALLDADDLWLPTKLAKQVELFQQDTNLGVVYCGAYEVDTLKKILRSYFPQKPWTPAGEQAFERIARRDDFVIAPLSSMVIRKVCFDHVGLFDPEIVQAEEWDWIFRIAYKWNINFVPEALVYYRMTGHFMPQKRLGRDIENAHLKILERGFEQIGNNASSCALKQQLVARTLWGTAMYWYALKQPTKAQQNLEKIANNTSNIFDFNDSKLLQSIAYIAWSLYDTVTPIQDALSFIDYVFTHLPLTTQQSQNLRRQTMAEVCAICAFDSAPRGEIWRVWEAVIRTIIYDPDWIKNRGLLKLPFKVISEKSMFGI